MTEPTAAPSYRLKLPCADEGEFREKFLQKYVSRGVFVPSERPRPVGTRIKLKLEIKGGRVLVSGDGMVTSVAMPGGAAKPGMTVRLTALHPDSIQFSLSPADAAAAAPKAAPPTLTPAPKVPPAAAPPQPPAQPAPLLTPPPIRRASAPPPPPPPQSLPPPPAPSASFKELFDLDDEPAAEPAAPDEGVMAITDTTIPVPSELLQVEAPGPAPTPPPVAPAAATARPRGANRRLTILLAIGAVIVVGATVAGVATSRSSRATRQAAARVDEQLRLADLRLLEGRLAGGGGDSALDHLLEARGAAPGDERVATRLKLLADKFEQLGDRALARKNLREASVHFKATLMADPTRKAARAKLDDIATRPPPPTSPR